MALVNSKRVCSVFRLLCVIIFVIIFLQLYHSNLSIQCKFTGFQLKTFWKVLDTGKSKSYRNVFQAATTTNPQKEPDQYIKTKQNRPNKNYQIQDAAGKSKQKVNDVCQKQTNVVFLKVHKTGSTTTWGIFARFAKAYNLNMVLPKQENAPRFNYLSSALQKLRETIMPLPENVSYNILCNHAIYNKTDFKEIMPSNTVYIGIMRNPVSVYVSGFYHFGHYRNSKLLHPRTDDKIVLHNFIKQDLTEHFLYSRPLNNGMSYDFGVPLSRTSDFLYMEKYIQELSKDFKLVLITELFDVSLVLMKRYLCWDLKDIMYLHVNRGMWRRRGKPQHLTESDKSKIKQRNQADVLMYEFFKARLKKQIEQEDESFYLEVSHFKIMTKKLCRFCARALDETDFSLFEESKWNSEFTVNKKFCEDLLTSELKALKKMIKKAKLKYMDKRN